MWCRRTDELVDGPNASRITPEALKRWDERLEALFAGKPYDVLDAALSDSIAKFSLDIQVSELRGGIGPVSEESRETWQKGADGVNSEIARKNGYDAHHFFVETHNRFHRFHFSHRFHVAHHSCSRSETWSTACVWIL